MSYFFVFTLTQLSTTYFQINTWTLLKTLAVTLTFYQRMK